MKNRPSSIKNTNNWIEHNSNLTKGNETGIGISTDIVFVPHWIHILVQPATSSHITLCLIDLLLRYSVKLWHYIILSDISIRNWSCYNYKVDKMQKLHLWFDCDRPIRTGLQYLLLPEGINVTWVMLMFFLSAYDFNDIFRFSRQHQLTAIIDAQDRQQTHRSVSWLDFSSLDSDDISGFSLW